MKIENEITLIPLDNIKVTKDRVRKIDTNGLEDVKESIKRRSLYHPILVSKEKGEYVLIAGEHRLEAFRTLKDEKSECDFEDYESWNKIPARVVRGDLSDLTIVQIEENIKRTQMYWIEEVQAIESVHLLYKQKSKDWTLESTAAKMGLSKTFIAKIIGVAKSLKDPKSKVSNAETLSAAFNVRQRELQAAVSFDLDTMHEINNAEKTPVDEKSEDPENQEQEFSLKKIPTYVAHWDFNEWAENYDGQKFNFIHCDFPYGIEHQRSGQGKAANYETYEDSPDIYFELLENFLKYRENFMLHTAHIMFWFAMKYYTETLRIVEMSAPEMTVNPYPLVWVKSDNKGILPDPQRGPRRIYETALIMSRNDRKIIKAKSNAYAAPATKNIHLSEKPVAMLRHFFEMFVDHNTRILDPTCGSGNALVAGIQFQPQLMMGLELNEEIANQARSSVTSALNIDLMARKQKMESIK